MVHRCRLSFLNVISSPRSNVVLGSPIVFLLHKIGLNVGFRTTQGMLQLVVLDKNKHVVRNRHGCSGCAVWIAGGSALGKPYPGGVHIYVEDQHTTIHVIPGAIACGGHCVCGFTIVWLDTGLEVLKQFQIVQVQG